MAHSLSRSRQTGLDRLARRADRLLRALADARLGVALLVVAGLANLLAAARADWRWMLDSPPYLTVVGAILITGVAAVAVRIPPVWREWRWPAPLASGRDVLTADLPLDCELTGAERASMLAALRSAGYRVIEKATLKGWLVAGTRRGWSRFAAIASHLSLVLLVVGGALGTAFAEENRFGLFPGEQSLLAAPRPEATSAVRFDGLDAAFDERGRPLRFDTRVTFIRAGGVVRSQVLQVNDPGSFDGYLVHAWTYGPAVELRVEDLGGRTLFDGWVALGGSATGNRAPFVELPSLGATIGVELANADANLARLIVADGHGVSDTIVLGPGERRRLGPTQVTLRGFAAYVTFLSRRDPGMGILFAGGFLLAGSQAIAFYLPRRRLDLRAVTGRLIVRVRGERFDDARPELQRVSRIVERALSQRDGGG
ncbi:MAG: cytochrome c biogenesis protein ResB [Chloroflexi bacterium]|nr:cytochrome c biogenesis protein ResB [Chloroflexota bacterium]